MQPFRAYEALTVMGAIVAAAGVCGLFFPRITVRFLPYRLLYRICMALLRWPAKPVSDKTLGTRFEGLTMIFLAVLWWTQLNPQVWWLREPLYDPQIHQWHTEYPENSPEEADILRRLNEVTARVLNPEGSYGVSTGLCAGVVYRDKTYLLRAGRKRLSDPEAPDADSIFEIGSITKVFTGTALASLVEEGRFKLDDPVTALLAWCVPNFHGRVITLRDLITHRSGLPRRSNDYTVRALLDSMVMQLLADPNRRCTPETVHDFLKGYALERAPGSAEEYSDLGVGLLGFALARRTRQSYEELIVRRVCEPLGMRNTRVGMTQEMTAHDVDGYVGPRKWKNLHLLYPISHWNMTEIYQGSDGLRSSIRDLLAFVKANLQAPEGPLGKALARVQTPLTETSRFPNCKLGYALMSSSMDGLKGPMYWHDGATGGYCSMMAFCREQQAGVVILATGAIQEELAQEILKELAK